MKTGVACGTLRPLLLLLLLVGVAAMPAAAEEKAAEQAPAPKDVAQWKALEAKIKAGTPWRMYPSATFLVPPTFTCTKPSLERRAWGMHPARWKAAEHPLQASYTESASHTLPFTNSIPSSPCEGAARSKTVTLSKSAA